MTCPDLVERVIGEQPYPFIFVTLSGAHLYGFASPDSDYDIRGCHVLPAHEVVGLDKGPETIDNTILRDGLELDVVSHDAEKFFGMLLKKNGYVLEQVFSPLVLRGGEDHERLRAIAGECITKRHAHHYLGFARGQWELFAKETPPRIKPLLYIYRVILTGIHLLRTGRVEANLAVLNESFRLSFIGDLIAQKREGAEKAMLADADVAFHRSQYEGLMESLMDARQLSKLPEAPSARRDLHDFLVELRLRKDAASS
ncbi:MAG: nucleotidyltransferase domain-containing protein [Planctomycetes bacterium]|nr:nucleotidyltransferase domain-containing protein [Planctomycetota bacterium]